MADEVADDEPASTAGMTALDLDKEESDSSDDKAGAEENRPYKGTVKRLYGGDGTSTRAMAKEEEKRLRDTAARLKVGRGDRSQDEAMPSTEVVENCRHNECVPSSARLANAAKT